MINCAKGQYCFSSYIKQLLTPLSKVQGALSSTVDLDFTEPATLCRLIPITNNKMLLSGGCLGLVWAGNLGLWN